MAYRYKIADLEYLCKRLNEVTKSPLKQYIRNESGKLEAQIGNFHLSQAYGGVCLHRIMSVGGGITKPISMGYETKKDAYKLIAAYLEGVESNA